MTGVSPTALRFELPLPQQRGNSREHWAAKYKLRKAYWEKCDNSVTLKQNPQAPRLGPWLKASAEIEMRTLQVMDQDNAEARLKDLLDWLQSRGYIVNDKDLVYTLTQKTSLRAECGITMTLVDTSSGQPVKP